jgi:Acetyl-CoA hydrolase/transferase C-terminal domain
VNAPLVVYVDGPGGPRNSPDAVVGAAGLSGEPEVILGWVLENHPWLAAPTLRGRTTMAGYALAPLVADGRLSPVSVRLSAIPSMLAHLRPDVCVATGIRRGDKVVFGSAIGWGRAAALASKCVVVEIDRDGFDFGGPEIPGNIVAVLPRPVYAHRDPVSRVADDTDFQIGANVMSLLPSDPTLQFGPGGTGEGIARSIDRAVGLWSGLVTDAMADVARRGLLRGKVTGSYVFGDEPVRALSRGGRLDLQPLDVTHDFGRISAIDRFVACNTALQVGFDGSVNIERVGGRTITSIGGHADFCAAAVRSVGGLSIIALPATNRRGESSIVPVVDTVSTPRCDVSAVVTEHGVADLRGVGDRDRVRLLVGVAAPEHRERLLATLA